MMSLHMDYSKLRYAAKSPKSSYMTNNLGFRGMVVTVDRFNWV